MEWPACSPDLNTIEQLYNQLGKAIHSIQSAEPTTNPPWTMGCNPTDQDHQTDPQHEEKVPSYHSYIGAFGGSTRYWLACGHKAKYWFTEWKTRCSIEVFGTFHYRPPPCSQTHSGATIIRKLHLLSQSKFNNHSFIDTKYMALESPMTNL